MVNSINSAYGTANDSLAESTASVLGKDDFLKLLVAELKYQDPMDPMKDRDFIAQMAQFSSLEQMQNLNNNFELMAQLNLMTVSFNTVSIIGKKIVYEDDSGQTCNGIVTGVNFSETVPSIIVDENKEISLEAVLKVVENKIPESSGLAEDDSNTEGVSEDGQ